MPEPVPTSKRSVRDELLVAATRLFARQGYDGTSLQQIADAVGIRKPSVLYHFPSKDALHQAVLDAMLSRWNDVLPALLLAAAREERFDATMEALVEFFLDDADRARLLVREVLDRPEAMRKRLETFVRPWITVVAGQLDRAREEGFVHDDADTEAYAVHVVNLVVAGAAMLETLGPVLPSSDVSPRERLRKEMLRFARAALFRRPPRNTPAKAGAKARKKKR